MPMTIDNRFGPVADLLLTSLFIRTDDSKWTLITYSCIELVFGRLFDSPGHNSASEPTTQSTRIQAVLVTNSGSVALLPYLFGQPRLVQVEGRVRFYH
jgi:hypothetical protein